VGIAHLTNFIEENQYSMNNLFLVISILSLLIWLYLLTFRGQFWLANQRLKSDNSNWKLYPKVSAIIPARNEALLLPITLKSLLTQEYPGEFSIILLDDQSRDGTGIIAQQTAEELKQSQRLQVISGKPLPSGWTGKVWALEQGINVAEQQLSPPDYFLLTDADINHDSTNLKELVAKAEKENLALVSLMVHLKTETFWEKFLIPAFVFFFQKLYPFPWVNNPHHQMAAAAGGCILIRRETLEKIGGIQILRQALIDDCTLAQAVKSSLQSPGENKQNLKSIWLGLSNKNFSLRSYDSLDTIWDMVTRTAFTQLNYSPLLLIGTVLGMVIIYLVPILGIFVGIVVGLDGGNWQIFIFGLLTWGLMAIAYLPTIKLYQISPLCSLTLPVIAFLYTLMTIDSALRHWRGKGGAWKGRVYSN
jgi:hopene-associated glycosyltransferase HpnB